MVYECDSSMPILTNEAVFDVPSNGEMMRVECVTPCRGPGWGLLMELPGDE